MNPEKKKEYAREWRLKNQAKTRQYQQAYREKNRGALSEKRKAWEAENPERVKELKARWYSQNKDKSQESSRRSALKRNYGITPEQRDLMLVEQDYKCAICRTADPGLKGWHVDHCHATSAVRGILCGPCNLLLGYAKDDVDTLAAAIKYLGA